MILSQLPSSARKKREALTGESGFFLIERGSRDRGYWEFDQSPDQADNYQVRWE
jgi:hypothetical protein